MSIIHDLIGRLHESGADRLMLASGKPAVLDVAGEPRHVDDGAPLTRDTLDAIIEHLGGMEDVGRHEFLYHAPSGDVLVTARRTERLVQLIVIPAEVGRPQPVGVQGESIQDIEDVAALAEEPSSFDGENARRDGMSVEDEPFEADPIVDDQRVDPVLDPFADEDTSELVGPDVMAHIDADLFEPPGPDASETRQPPESFEGSVPEDPVEPSSADARLTEPASEAAERVFEVRPDAPAMERLFVKMVEHGCSDLHVSSGCSPLFRKDGRITDIGGEPPLSASQTEALLNGITPDRYRKQFEETNDADFAYQIPGVARFRCNLFRDRKGMGGVFRQIPADILGADALGLPGPLLDMCQLKKGLVLVTGPTGCGKSTTLAALIDHINSTRHDHIITIEDPIEFVHENRRCLVNQREIGEHTKSFKVALRAALREDPDIVLVGELRDLETVEIALETAETGHLVFGTLHTNTAPGTVSRLIDQFPAGQQAQIRTILADTLNAVVAQTLCRRKDGGRIAALEILVVTNAVANLIREDKAYQIPSAMQTGRAQGMRTLNDALLDLVVRRVVDVHEAYWNAVDKPEFLGVLSRNGIELEGFGAQ